MTFPRNTPDKPASTDSIDEVAGRELLAFIERLERIEEERKSLGDDLKDIYGEVRSRGFDAKTVKAIVAIRRKDPAERTEQETILGLYLEAIERARL